MFRAFLKQASAALPSPTIRWNWPLSVRHRPSRARSLHGDNKKGKERESVHRTLPTSLLFHYERWLQALRLSAHTIQTLQMPSCNYTARKHQVSIWLFQGINLTSSGCYRSWKSSVKSPPVRCSSEEPHRPTSTSWSPWNSTEPVRDREKNCVKVVPLTNLIQLTHLQIHY